MINPSNFVRAEINRLSYYITKYQNPTAGLEPVMLEMWKINGAKDELCLQYDGTIWEVNTGPYPEADTHPNCKCERIPFAGDLTDPAGVRITPPATSGPVFPTVSPQPNPGGQTGLNDIPLIGTVGLPLVGGLSAIWAAEVERERKKRQREEAKKAKEADKERAKKEEAEQGHLQEPKPVEKKKPGILR